VQFDNQASMFPKNEDKQEVKNNESQYDTSKIKGDNKKEEKLSGTSKLFFNNAQKRYPNLNESNVIEISKKIQKNDKDKTSEINAVAEAIMYASVDPNDHFSDTKDVFNRAMEGKYTEEPRAKRIIEIGVGGELEKKAKEINDNFLNFQNKTKSLDPPAKGLLKTGVERFDFSVNEINKILDSLKGDKLVDVAEALHGATHKDDNIENESTKEITLDTFKEIAKKAKDPKDFIEQTRKITNVPPEVAKEFFDKYADGGKLSQEQSAKKFMEEVNQSSPQTVSSDILDSVKKYGWSAEKEGGNVVLSNKKGKVVSISQSGDKYTLNDMVGNKLMSGKGNLPQSIEKLLTSYYYAKPI
jgi:hypothetical protein